MAESILAGGQTYGPFLVDDRTSIAVLYYYPGVPDDLMGGMSVHIGRVKKDGTLVEGELIDALQGETTAITFSSTNPVLEIDGDTTTPYSGRLRMKMAVA